MSKAWKAGRRDALGKGRSELSVIPPRLDLGRAERAWFLGQQCRVGVFASLRPSEEQLDESKERHPILWARSSQGPCPPQWSSLSWPRLQHSSFFLGKMLRSKNGSPVQVSTGGGVGGSAPSHPVLQRISEAFPALPLWLLSYCGSNELTAERPCSPKPPTDGHGAQLTHLTPLTSYLHLATQCIY